MFLCVCTLIVWLREWRRGVGEVLTDMKEATMPKNKTKHNTLINYQCFHMTIVLRVFRENTAHQTGNRGEDTGVLCHAECPELNLHTDLCLI